MVTMRNAARRKDVAIVVVQAQANRGVEVGAAKRAERAVGAAAASGNLHGAKSASVHDPAVRIAVDVAVDAKAPLWGRN